jgi:hypothetical protein
MTKFDYKENGEKKPIYFFLSILAVIVIVTLISFTWHSFAISNPQFEFSLVEYNDVVTVDDVCFRVEQNSTRLNNKIETLYVKVNDSIVYTEDVNLLKNMQKEICVPNAFFDKENNLVRTTLFSRELFFNVEKVDSFELVERDLEINSFSKLNGREAELDFYIKNLKNKKEAVSIYLNDNLVRRTFYEDGNNSETIALVNGENNLRIEFGDIVEENFVNNVVPIGSNLILGILIMAFSLFVLITTVYSKREFLENLIFSISTFFIIMMILFFVLNYTGLLSEISFVFLFLLINIIIFVLFKPYFKIPEINLRLPNSFEFFLILFLLATLLFNLITPTNVSFWTSFYERQSETIFEIEGIPFNDLLSEFGEKPFAYVSSYFFVNSGISFLIGDFSTTGFALLMFFANTLLFLSSINFFNKLNKSYNKALLTVMLMLLGGFILGDIFFNIRHVIAIALMFVSLSMFFDKSKFAFILAAFAIWVQPPIIITIALVSFILINQPLFSKIKYYIYSLIIGLIIALPTLLIHGIPTQAKSTTWGYLFGMPWYGVVVDLLAQLIFFFIIMLGVNKFNPKLTDSSKKVLLFLGLLIIVQLFISYRVNTAVIIIFSFIAVKLFPTNYLNKFEVRHLLFVIFLGGSIFASSVLLNYVVPDFAISSTDHLELITSTNDHIMNAPALGHYTAYFSNRLIMSDLAVEYASGEKIDTSFNFFENPDRNILDKYNIDYIFNKKYLIETQPVGSVERAEPIEFTIVDKVYDNGVFFIHYVN